MFVITGASDGLGQELAKLLLEQGKQVVSISRHQPADGIEWIQADLSKEPSAEAAAKQVLAREEPLEALVNCAGVFSGDRTEDMKFAELERVFHTNVLGHMLLTSRLLERIKHDHSDIANVASIVAIRPHEGQIVYDSSKWAVRGFGADLQFELKDTPCRVITFCPGGFRSHLFEKAGKPPVSDPENWMDPKDVARCLLQLLQLPKNMEVSEIVINRKPAAT